MKNIPVISRKLAVLLLLLTTTYLAACGGNESYEETFDQPGSWSVGEDIYSTGSIHDGIYDFTVIENDISRWASAGRSFGDGVYQVTATPVAGPVDNGYGLIFRADPEAGNFYLFKVSADGYVWIGRYKDGVEEKAIVGDHWFSSPAVQQGLNVANTLRVEAEAGNMIFYVNGQEVGRVTDDTYRSGDAGVLVQTLGGGGVRVHFDDFSVKPISR